MKEMTALQDCGFPASMQIFPIQGVDLGVIDGEHPWVAENLPAIESNWEKEVGDNPALFNGRMVFQRALSFDGRVIKGRAHLVPFAAFLHWRRQERPNGGYHLFALPLILSGDGALIAIRMAGHTANPGRVYCAAGSMDASDIRDGKCDIEFNMMREVREETGLDLEQARIDNRYFAIHDQNTVTILRRYRFDRSAADILDAIGKHIAEDPDPEIDCGLAIRDADPHSHAYPFFMPPVLRWLFEQRG